MQTLAAQGKIVRENTPTKEPQQPPKTIKENTPAKEPQQPPKTIKENTLTKELQQPSIEQPNDRMIDEKEAGKTPFVGSRQSAQ